VIGAATLGVKPSPFWQVLRGAKASLFHRVFQRTSQQPQQLLTSTPAVFFNINPTDFSSSSFGVCISLPTSVHRIHESEKKIWVGDKIEVTSV
jgi:hypothetical protein